MLSAKCTTRQENSRLLTAIRETNEIRQEDQNEAHRHSTGGVAASRDTQPSEGADSAAAVAFS